tara:strand:- start:307 stop:504 length:198 start_codon:yes stop_codon:yes gene_type:complete
MENLALYLLVNLIIAIALRLWGNFSIQLLTGINPKRTPIKNRIIHWIASFFIATLLLEVIEKVNV